jgi:hypothetical protein
MVIFPRAELFQKTRIHFSFVEGRTSDDDLARAARDNFPGASDGSNAAAHAHFHSKVLARSCA